MDPSQMLYAVLRWTSDKDKLSIEHMKVIVNPNKAYNDFLPGEECTAKFGPSNKSLYPVTIVAVGHSKKSLDDAFRKALEERNKEDEHTDSPESSENVDPTSVTPSKTVERKRRSASNKAPQLNSSQKKKKSVNDIATDMAVTAILKSREENSGSTYPLPMHNSSSTGPAVTPSSSSFGPLVMQKSNSTGPPVMPNPSSTGLPVTPNSSSTGTPVTPNSRFAGPPVTPNSTGPLVMPNSSPTGPAVTPNSSSTDTPVTPNSRSTGTLVVPNSTGPPVTPNSRSTGPLVTPNSTGPPVTSNSTGPPVTPNSRSTCPPVTPNSSSTCTPVMPNSSSTGPAYTPYSSSTGFPVTPNSRSTGPPVTPKSRSTGPPVTPKSTGPPVTPNSRSTGPLVTPNSRSTGPLVTPNCHFTGPPDTPNSHFTGPPDTPNSPSTGPPDTPNSPSTGPLVTPNSHLTGPPDTPNSHFTGPPDTPNSHFTGPPDTPNPPSTGPLVMPNSNCNGPLVMPISSSTPVFTTNYSSTGSAVTPNSSSTGPLASQGFGFTISPVKVTQSSDYIYSPLSASKNSSSLSSNSYMSMLCDPYNGRDYFGQPVRPKATYLYNDEASHHLSGAFSTLYGSRPVTSNKCHSCCDRVDALERQVAVLQESNDKLQESYDKLIKKKKSKESHETQSQDRPSHLCQQTSSLTSSSQQVKSDYTKETLVNDIKDMPPNDAINQLMLTLFSTEELITCSVMGVQNGRSSSNQGLDPVRRTVLESIIKEKYGMTSTAIRGVMRNRKKIIKMRNFIVTSTDNADSNAEIP